MDEIFAFQDKLDAVRDEPEKVWQVVDAFFDEAENQLELSPKFLRELQKIDLEEDSIPIKDADELLDNKDNYKKDKKYDIPFIPIHNFQITTMIIYRDIQRKYIICQHLRDCFKIKLFDHMQ